MIRFNRIIKGSFIGIGILILSAIIYKIVEGFNDLDKASKETLHVTYSFPKEYSSLFPTEMKQKLIGIKVFNSKVRNPIIAANLDNKFSIILYKLDLNTEQALRNIVNVNETTVERTTGITYSVIDLDNFKLQFKSGGEMLSTNIQLTLAGDSIDKKLIGDSIVAYNLFCKNFSIRYDKNQPIDILFDSDYSWFRKKSTPVLISFKKQSTDTFLIMVTSIDINRKVPLELINVFFKNT